MDIPVQTKLKTHCCKIALHEYNPNPQKYVPSLHLKSQLRLRPSVKFQMHILAPSDKRLPMHAIYKGVVIDHETLKFTMFADDVLLFLSGTNDQFSRKFDVLLEFSSHSNCNINLSNCQAFHIGSNRNCVDKPVIDKGLKWPTETIKYLGVLVPVKNCYDNAKKLLELNFVPLLNKMKNILSF